MASKETVKMGVGPPLEVDDFPPTPKPLNLPNMMKIWGPSAIALGVGVGAGEWLIGPAAVARYGLVLLWVLTVSVFLQLMIDLECNRYTVYCGEPMLNGYMRVKPGPKLWGSFWIGIGLLQAAWPGWALASATALAAGYLGRIPDPAKFPADKGLVVMFGYLTYLLVVALVLFGPKIERSLEIANWGMMIFGIGTVTILAVAFAPPAKWGEAAIGLLSFGSIPKGADWLLISAFAGYCGLGGFPNNVIANWYRDKGVGMGAKVGYIPALIGGKVIKVSPVGKVPRMTEGNKREWKNWWRIMQSDMVVVFWGGSMIGMVLPSLLWSSFLPLGSIAPPWAIAAFLPEAMAEKVGFAVGWVLVLAVGFVVLFSTQLGFVEGPVRAITDMVWWASSGVRKWAKEDIRRVYYVVLGVNVVWGLIGMNLTAPFILLLLGAAFANLLFMCQALMTLYTNRTFLPKEFRPQLWRQLALIGGVLWYGFFFFNWVAFQFFGFGIK